MKFVDYQDTLKGLTFGKTLPDSIYIHVDGLSYLPPALIAIITKIQKKLDPNSEYNIIKLHKRQFRLSLLRYPDFDSDAFPALEKSILVDLEKGSAKEAAFDQRSNPPILHRKEAFLPKNDSRRNLFTKITKEAEALGLYQDTKIIGFRQNWENILSEKGLSIEGHTIIKKGSVEKRSSESVEVDRHKTAMVRYDFSKPVKHLIQSGLLKENSTILDYGCGHGADVSGLRKLGHDVAAWDPVHLPEGELRKSSYVNLGYVINVIENPTERVETLLNAWSYASKLLIVSAMIRGGDNYANARAYGDGVITNLNTFQKYYEQSELQTFIESALQLDAVPAAPGIFFIFRDESDQQDYLANRSRRIIDWRALSARLEFGSPQKRERAPRLSIYEKHSELLEDFWGVYVDLARPPHRDEYQRSDEVRKACQSIPRAIRLFEEKYGTDVIEERRIRRTDDLRVYLAEQEFKKKRTPFNKLSASLRRDINEFFTNYAEACAESRDLLFSAGDPMELEIAVESLDFGFYDDDEGHYLFHRSLLDELPAILRAYVGCGKMLYGDLSDIDLLKIHLTSGKLTLQTYKGFERLNLPELQARIKIDLRRLSIQVFEAEEGKTQLFYFKERILPQNSPLREKAEAFTRKLAHLGLNEDQVGRYGPTKEQLSQALGQLGYTYSLKKIKK